MNKNIFKFIGLLLFTVMFFSCRPTKYLGEFDKLLVKNKVKIISNDEKEDLNKDDMLGLVRPKPNSKILFMRLNLRIYNLYSPEKTKIKEARKTKRCKARQSRKITKHEKNIRRYEYNRSLYPKETKEYSRYNRKLKKAQENRNKVKNKDCEHTLWTHRLGEAPVLFKMNEQYRNVRQLRIFLKNKGYYYPIVKPKTKKIGKKKIKVEYIVKPGKPYRLKSQVEVFVEDTAIEKALQKMPNKKIMKAGVNLDVDLLQEERNRVTQYLRNQGYFAFTKKYITYSVDTTIGNMQAEVKMYITNEKKGKNSLPHKKYFINKVNIYPNFDPRFALTQKNAYLNSFQKKRYLSDNHLYTLFDKGKPELNPKTIMQGIYINKDSLYTPLNIQATYKYLTGMEIIKIANINLEEVKNTNDNDSSQLIGLLDCDIKISNNLAQARTFEIQGTHTNGNIGAAGSFTYTHRNLFRGAEVLNLLIKGGLERQTNYASASITEPEKFFNSRELVFEAGIKFPRFLAPLRFKQFIKRNNPGTKITMNYSFLHRPDYTRTMAGFSYGYFWKSLNTIQHKLKPIIFDYVDLRDPTEDFMEYIRRYNLQGSYEDHFILGSGYSFVFNNSKTDNKRNAWYFRANTKLVGNSLYAIMHWARGNKKPVKTINNNIYAQFFKLDFDLRYYARQPLINNTLVMRLFAGAAFPYGNLKVLPFGEKYFSGGANGVRAWHVRSLGPGAYTFSDETDRFPNRTADIKLEGNIEYRFKLFWVLEGAYFIDAGNIWAINSQDDREGALFEFDDFYKEIAIGSGIGFRLDFDFFIIRFDFGIKLKDPALPVGKRWIPLQRNFKYKDWTFNLGIGYPF